MSRYSIEINKSPKEELDGKGIPEDIWDYHKEIENINILDYQVYHDDIRSSELYV